jgi:hypothetical protein
MPDFLSEKRKEIETRLRELRPLVEEYQRLERAAAALDGVAAPGRAGRRKSTNGRRRRRRRGRPRGTGTRAIQAQELVKANPGITIRELAGKMGIKANYLYRVMPTLQSEGKVRKRGQGWHPA